MTPLHYAARENCVAIVRVLAKDYHANMDAIMTVRTGKETPYSIVGKFCR